MAKASMTLPDGTIVIVEGNPDEIKKIINLHRTNPFDEGKKPEKKQSKKKHTRTLTSDSFDLQELVNQTKSSGDFDLIEINILDRNSLVDRILLPLYIAAKHISEQTGLTSGEISQFLSQLGVSIAQPNVAKTLSSTALKYVIGDKIRKKGHAVRYRLSRRGMQYITTVIKGKAND